MIIDVNNMQPYDFGMPAQLLYLRDLPKYENLKAAAKRYPELDPESIAAYILLLRVASDVGNTINGSLEEHGISHGRFTVMNILNRNPDQGLCPAELADKAGVTRATMTGLLDGLEEDGLVAREGHLADRRMLTVRLTKKGIGFLEKVLPGYLKRLNVAMSPLSSEERHTLAALLNKLGGHALTLQKPE